MGSQTLDSRLRLTCLEARDGDTPTPSSLPASSSARSPLALSGAGRSLPQGRGLGAPRGQGGSAPTLLRSPRSRAAELSRLRPGAGHLPRAPHRLRASSLRRTPAPPRPVHCSRPDGDCRAAARRGFDPRGGAGSQGPAEESGGPDGCRRVGHAWMRREPEASSSPRRLCPRAPYGLKVRASRMERQAARGQGRSQGEEEGGAAGTRSLPGHSGAVCLGPLRQR